MDAETRRALDGQAEHAKRMLDEIDEMIADDKSLMFDADTLRARQMYSAEWRACIDMLRKAGDPKQTARGGKFDAMRASVKAVRTA